MTGIKLQIKTKPLFVFILLLLISCLPPKNKETYLDDFEAFVIRVDENHGKYNKKDWEWAESRFEKFNNEWYLKFKDEFTLQDQVKVKTLIIKYNTLKNNEDFGKVLKDLFENDLKEAKKKVENYVGNDLEDDLDKIIEGACSIGDSAVKVLEDVINKLDKSF